MVSEKEWKPKMVKEFWQPEDPKVGKD